MIHVWAELQARSILANIRQAIKPTPRLVLIESVIPETPAFVATAGRERTAAEYAELYAKARFELEQIVPTTSPHSMIIGSPRA